MRLTSICRRCSVYRLRPLRWLERLGDKGIEVMNRNGEWSPWRDCLDGECPYILEQVMATSLMGGNRKDEEGQKDM